MKETVDEKTKSWLVNTPSGDINFRCAMERANAATIRSALAELEGQPASKTAIKALQARLRRLERHPAT